MIPARPRRRNPRLSGYDYSSEGLYFVTICTHRRDFLFGEVIDGTMNLNEEGSVVREVWADMFGFSDDTETWIVMPNHVHGIVEISGITSTGKSLGRFIAAFKTVTTRRINEIRRTPGCVIWQRNFYEHIIGTDRALENIVAYIQENPMRWQRDPDNPMAMGPDQNNPWD